jgi:hypothetical protein
MTGGYMSIPTVGQQSRDNSIHIVRGSHGTAFWALTKWHRVNQGPRPQGGHFHQYDFRYIGTVIPF